MTEYEELREVFEQAKYGSYLLIPFKYKENEFRADWLEANTKKDPLTTMDINESVKQTINAENTPTVISRYKLEKEMLIKEITGKSEEIPLQFYVGEKEKPDEYANGRFELKDSYIYVFHTQVAFLCLGIQYTHMRTLDCICNLGYADRKAIFFYRNDAGSICQFCLEKILIELCKKAGLEYFYQNESSIFLESYIYNLAVVKERFRDIETIRQATFNLHLMTDLKEAVEDDSEEDIYFVYAVKAQKLGSYRWGCCITSQTISYIVANQDMDIEAEMEDQAENGIPVVLLALYQKYTCLRFRELLAIVDKKKIKRLKQLRKQMLEFQAYGTIAPANISRWHNIKQIYKYVIETNAIQEAIEDISITLSILAEHQKELESTRNNTIISLITIFGIVSILASVLTIVQILSGGGSVEWLSLIVFSFGMLIMIIVVLLYQNKE